MMLRRVLSGSLAAVLVLALAVSCGRHEDRGHEAASAGAAVSESPAPSDTAAAGAVFFAFSEADLDAYERGFQKEIELVQSARERGIAAKTPEERARAAQAEWEDQTAPEAARSLGLSPERYRQTRDAVNRVLETLDFQGKIEGPKEINMELASPELKARLTEDPFAALPPASASALRTRLDRLVPLWVEYVNLTAVGG